MLRLFRLLVTLVVLLGLVPCSIREAVPVVGELASSCCPGDDDEEESENSLDCCGTSACACVIPAVVLAPVAPDLHPASYELQDPPPRLERPRWRAGPPPTPPPVG